MRGVGATPGQIRLGGMGLGLRDNQKLVSLRLWGRRGTNPVGARTAGTVAGRDIRTI